MSVARFIANQRTMYRVPHTVVCALLGVSLAWFYKWLARAAAPSATSGLLHACGPSAGHDRPGGAGDVYQEARSARLASPGPRSAR